MMDLFLKIFNMSISAGWLALVVMALRLLLRRAPRWLPVALWGLVGMRLVIPISYESAFSLIPSAETIRGSMLLSQEPELTTGVPSFDMAVNPLFTKAFAPDPVASANPLQILVALASLLWMAGVAAMLLYAIFSWGMLRRRVAGAAWVEPGVCQSGAVCSPFVLGLIRPRIYLPFPMGEQERLMALAHERAHISRGDHIWKFLGFLLLSVYWFHPLMWLSYALLCRDMEYACDERIVRDLDREGRAGYSQAILNCSSGRRSAPDCPLAFGEVGVKGRVRATLHYKKPAFWAALVSVAVCVVVAVCFLTDPKVGEYQIPIRIPAGGSGVFYSDTEISPLRDEVRFWVGRDIGDTEISLEPVEVRQETAYDEPQYATPGMVTVMQAEQGGWFRVGVSTGNPTGQDKVVYVTVSPVEVRGE